MSPAIATIKAEHLAEIERLRNDITRTRKEHLSTLYGAKMEIERLRRKISILEPLAQAYDAICTVLRIAAPAPREGGMAPDPLWHIEQEIRDTEQHLDIKRKDDANG